MLLVIFIAHTCQSLH